MSELLQPAQDIGHEIETIRTEVPRGGALQQVRTTYQTAVAVQKPRDLREVQRKLLQEAELAAEGFYYGWAAGKDRIEGPSVELALAAARLYGNCAVEMLPVQETGDAWIFTAHFIDLESGFTLPRQFRQSKRWTVYGKLDAERKDDVRFQIGQSKAIRNAIVNGVPKWLVKRAMDKAMEGARKRIDDYINKHGIEKARELAMGELKKLGVSEERVLARMGRAGVGGLEPDDLVILRGDIEAIRQGAERADELFPAAQEDGSEHPKSGAEQVKQAFGKGGASSSGAGKQAEKEEAVGASSEPAKPEQAPESEAASDGEAAAPAESQPSPAPEPEPEGQSDPEPEPKGPQTLDDFKAAADAAEVPMEWWEDNRQLATSKLGPGSVKKLESHVSSLQAQRDAE